jgi:hypothetical protein
MTNTFVGKNFTTLLLLTIAIVLLNKKIILNKYKFLGTPEYLAPEILE